MVPELVEGNKAKPPLYHFATGSAGEVRGIAVFSPFDRLRDQNLKSSDRIDTTRAVPVVFQRL